LAADLVAGKVDLIVNEGGTASALAAKQATSKIPIVFNASDAVAEGLVASLSRPGGNLTGVSQLSPEIWPKLLQMAAELVPRARLVAVLVNPENPVIARQLDVLQQAAGQIGIELSILKAGSEGAIEAVFDRLGGVHADALVVPPDLFFTEHREKLVALAARHRIAAVYGQNIFARTGGLIAYQSDQLSVYRLKGVYAGKILDGAKPADLPVQQPTKFDLVINLKTAKALGLTVPQALLARADEVIE
jgi:putative ABC transport system substrate-binding protein